MIRSIREKKLYLRSLGLQHPINIFERLEKAALKILIVGMKRIGDLIVILPAIKEIKKNFPSDSITVMGIPEHKELIYAQNIANHYIDFSENSSAFHAEASKYDLIFIFREWYDTDYSYQKGPISFTFSTDILVGKPKLAHLHYLDALKMLGFNTVASRPVISVPAEKRKTASNLLKNIGIPPHSKKLLIAIHPGSGYEEKQWSVERFSEVCKYLVDNYNAKLLIIQGPDDKNIIKNLAFLLPQETYSIISNIPLLELASILKRCTFFFGNDSGIMHLADAVNCPVVAIFGPSRPKVWGPANLKSVTIVRDDIWEHCPYCSNRHLKDKPCMRSDISLCLNSITVHDVIGGIESLISLLNIRKKYECFDNIKLPKHIVTFPFENDKLVLCNPETLKPLFIFNNRRLVENALSIINKNASYKKLIEINPEFRVFIDILFTYNLLLPGGKTEKEMSATELKNIWQILTHKAFINYGKHLYNGNSGYIQEKSSIGIGLQNKTWIKNILLVNSIHPSIYGGGERWMIKAGKGLRERGYEVYCWGIKGHQWLKDAQKEGLLIFEKNIPLANNYHELPDLVSYIKKQNIHSAIMNLDRDIINVALPLKLADVKFVAIRKGLQNFDLAPTKFWMYQVLTDGMIVPSRRMKKEFLEKKIFEPERIWHLPNGTNTSNNDSYDKNRLKNIRNLLDINEYDTIILTVGRLSKQKGTKYLIRALPYIIKKYPDIKLLIIGSGILEKKLKEEVILSGFMDKVIFLDERWKIKEYFGLADIFVLPSLYEGMSNALLEAMAAGLPVISTCVSGSEEIIENNVTGLLVPVANSRAIAEAVNQIISLGCKKSYLAKNAKKHIHEHYSTDKMICSLEKILHNNNE
jgi:glycosyltransferase involved in cell wall biosynthesis/ADP-heptose:LPS heptosyltransferase